MMIGFAEVHGLKGLRDLATYLLSVIVPEVAETTEAAALEAQDRAARKTQYLRLRDDGDGCTTITGKLPAADGEALRAVVEVIANGGKRTGGGDSAATDEDGTDATDGGASGSETPLSYEARRAQALMTLVRAYLAGGDGPRHGGDRPRVTVVVKYEDLLRGIGGATLLGSGIRISAAEARFLACDADILPAVMGSNSQLLDMGRTTRLFTGDLRQAIALRDRGCVFPGCHREPRDCDAHHIRPWTQIGPTSLDNAALVCPHPLSAHRTRPTRRPRHRTSTAGTYA